jgi:uncharacterized protein (DUF433 family)
MSTANEYPHVTFDADGTARIDGTRYKVLHLAAEHYHHGWTAEELMRQHPDLRPEQVYSALAYFYDHHASLLSHLKASQQAGESFHPSQPVSRDELLRRKSAAGG